MSDMRATIIPKSDQMNADDLIGTTRTITITKVLLTVEADQPVAIHFDGDGGKPYMACKSMRRVMVNVWGPDANAYAGRSMTLYRDDKVQFGGLAVGGIRISHMSHIDAPVTMALTATRANRKPFTVKPLAVETAPKTAGTSKKQTVDEWLTALETDLRAAQTLAMVETVVARPDVQKATGALRNGALDRLNAMIAAALARFQPASPKPGDHDYIAELDDPDHPPQMET